VHSATTGLEGSGLTALRLPVEEFDTSCGLWFLHRLKNPPANGDRDLHLAIRHATLVPTRQHRGTVLVIGSPMRK
jgi:hypothetical protein